MIASANDCLDFVELALWSIDCGGLIVLVAPLLPGLARSESDIFLRLSPVEFKRTGFVILVCSVSDRLVLLGLGEVLVWLLLLTGSKMPRLREAVFAFFAGKRDRRLEDETAHELLDSVEFRCLSVFIDSTLQGCNPEVSELF